MGLTLHSHCCCYELVGLLSTFSGAIYVQFSLKVVHYCDAKVLIEFKCYVTKVGQLKMELFCNISTKTPEPFLSPMHVSTPAIE